MENTHETARPSVASTGLDNSSRSQGCDVLVELRNVGGLAATPVTWHLDRAASASGAPRRRPPSRDQDLDRLRGTWSLRAQTIQNSKSSHSARRARR